MARRTSNISDAPLLAWGDALRRADMRRRRITRRMVITAIGILAVMITIVAPPRPRFVWNASASAPVGLYLVTPEAPIEPGDMVIAQVPVRYRMLAAQRHYLPLNVPLVKRVTASAGDDICAFGHDMYLNGKWIAARRSADGQQRPLPTWHGCIRLRGHQLFLMMDHPASFDGRYFGITEAKDVIGKAQLLWTKPTQSSGNE